MIHDQRYDLINYPPRRRIRWNVVMPYIMAMAAGVWLAFIVLLWVMQ